MPARHFSETPLTVPQAIARVLVECGIDMTFGVPGGNSMQVYDGLYDYRSEIRSVLVRHESLAGVMAEVYGRLTGKPGVVIGQGLFLLSNALLGVLEARLGSSPVLLLTDLTDGAPFSQHAPYQSGTGEYGTWDARASFAGAVKAVFESHDAVQAVQQTQMAVKHAVAGQAGPVALLYHSSALKGTIGPGQAPHVYATGGYLTAAARQSADHTEIERVAALLAAARQPVIIAGNGVRISRATDELRRLSEALGAPVVTTATGKGVFAENHSLALGVFGTFGLPAANAFIAAADVVLAVGTKLAPSDTAFENTALIDPRRQTLIQIDIEPRNAAWTYPCDRVLIGDAAAVLAQLSQAALSPGRLDAAAVLQARSAAVRAVRAEHGYFDEPDYAAAQSPLLPQRIVTELIKASAPDAMVTCDAGENRLFMTRFFQTRSAGGFLSPAATGGMGYAIPAALACKLLHPQRQAIAVCGDGGFGMSMNGLLTAKEENIPIVVVVMNNNALGWVKHFQRGREIASEFPCMSAAPIAQAMGCAGFRAETAAQLAAALKEALACGRPAVVDVAAALDISYRDILSPLAAV
ncbi:MAG: thiamine pyrophosphate-binding protein [Desulfobacterales bacterium]|jgi:acetolactate synthase-1/2/3 large subunit|nr:thiamine pyrophosphate-binding protein [Desulfobacterales bacterium]